MQFSNDIRNIGVNDHEIDLFEGQFSVPKGMAYNSYLILDEKIGIMDSVGGDLTDEWFANIEKEIGDRQPDYIIIQHMEPDHSANIAVFMERYPKAVIVSSAKSFEMMRNFFGTDFSDRQLVVSDKSTLALGKHTLSFVAAPMVHWPEVIVTYDDADKTLFSADAFGKFGALDTDEDWTSEARRYYFGIVAKFGMQVQALLKKTAAFDIQRICPLHGPVIDENIDYYLDKYNTWSSFEAESEGVLIAYTSVYGNTEKAVVYLADKLEELGCPKVVAIDLAREDMSAAVEDAFRYGKLVLATTTYNGSIFPFMKDFINHLTERGYRNRRIGMIENGSWAVTAAGTMCKMLEPCKDITYAKTTVTIKSAMNEANFTQLDELAKEMIE